LQPSWQREARDGPVDHPYCTRFMGEDRGGQEKEFLKPLVDMAQAGYFKRCEGRFNGF